MEAFKYSELVQIIDSIVTVYYCHHDKALRTGNVSFCSGDKSGRKALQHRKTM